VEGDGDFAVHVETIARKQLVLPHVQHDEQVAGRAAARAAFALAGQPHARSGIDAGGHVEADLARHLHASFAAALAAGMADDFAGAAAMGARLANLEKAVGADDHAPPAALGAGGALAAAIGAGAAARFAILDDLDGQFALDAERGLFEIDFEVVAQVGAARAAVAVAHAAAHAAEETCDEAAADAAAAPAAERRREGAHGLFQVDVAGAAEAAAAVAALERAPTVLVVARSQLRVG